MYILEMSLWDYFTGALQIIFKCFYFLYALFASIVNFVFTFFESISFTPLSTFLIASFALVIVMLIITFVMKLVG